jgi:hypothetical protein
MTRRQLILAATFTVSCRRTPQSAEFIFPGAIGAGWKLASTEPVPDESVPDQVRQLGLRSALRGRYEGPATLTITVYEMTSSGGAFELVQRWRPGEGRLATYVNSLFIVLESEEMDHTALTAAVESLEAALKDGR